MLFRAIRAVRLISHLMLAAGAADQIGAMVARKPRARNGGTGYPTPRITYQERLVAALAHLCLVLNLVSVIGGSMLVFLLLAVGPDTTGFVKRQARQALLWQAQVLVVSVAAAAVGHVAWRGWQQAAIVPLELLLWLLALSYALCAAILCLRGRPFRYWRWC